jgi:adenosylcobinamide-GDP ribazoletransferase
MRRFLAAVRFLTILPVPGGAGTAAEDLAGSVPFFPVVGLLLGVVAGVVAGVLGLLVSPMLAGAGVVVLLAAFSGGLHMDGLSDSADGMLSSRPRERILEIMKDSHVGAMGVMAIVCVLMVKFAALASVGGGNLWAAAAFVPLAGRCAILVHMAILPYARPEGLGKIFCPSAGSGSNRRRAVGSAIWGAALLAGLGWLMFGWQGLVLAAICVAVAVVMAGYFYSKIGGCTGDTFGAVCELVELAAAVVVSAWPLRSPWADMAASAIARWIV